MYKFRVFQTLTFFLLTRWLFSRSKLCSKPAQPVFQSSWPSSECSIREDCKFCSSDSCYCFQMSLELWSEDSALYVAWHRFECAEGFFPLDFAGR